MSIIILITFVIYIVLVLWTWQNMLNVDKTKKIIFIIISLFIIFLITLIVFNISKSGINYQNEESQKTVRNMLVSIFTGLNGIIIMPYIAKLINQIVENNIKKEEFIKRILILVVIFLICIVFECGYLKNTQEGILRVYSSSMKKGF